MKTYEDFIVERVSDPEFANRKPAPVRSRFDLGLNRQAREGLGLIRKERQFEKKNTGPGSFRGSIDRNLKPGPAMKTNQKAPKLNTNPNINYSSRTSKTTGNQTSSGLI